MIKKWWKEGIVYQIFPRSFYDSNNDGIGDINGITSKLDYLEFLGVNIICLCPIFASSNFDYGNDIYDFKAIMNEFGNIEDFNNLIKEAHKRKFKIILDMTINHTSIKHPWFVESKSSNNNQRRDYYIWSKKINSNSKSLYNESAWKYDEETDEYYYHLLSCNQPELNWKNDALRKEYYDTLQYWLKLEIDGIKFDLLNSLLKDENLIYESGSEICPNNFNNEGIHELIQEMKGEVLSKYDVVTVGTMPKISTSMCVDYTNNKHHELDFAVNTDILELGNNNFQLSNWKVEDFKSSIIMWQQNIYEKGWIGFLLGNHNHPRSVSKWGDDLFYWKESAKMLATLTLTLYATPIIYQGDEIGMTNAIFDKIDYYRDYESIGYYYGNIETVSSETLINTLNIASRDNSRTPMQWNNDNYSGFSNTEPWISINSNYSFINVSLQQNDEDSILNYYRKLIKIRKAHFALIYGKFVSINVCNKNVLAYTRIYESETYFIILNLKGNTEFITTEFIEQTMTLIISNYPKDEISFTELKPYESRIYRLFNNNLWENSHAYSSVEIPIEMNILENTLTITNCI